MGLFGDLFGSSSHSQTTTSTSQVTNTQLAGGSIDAPTVYGSGNRQTVTINSVDPGAVKLGQAALIAGAGVAQLGLNASMDISHEARVLGLGGLTTGAQVANAGLDVAQHAYTDGLNFAGDVSARAINSAGTSADRVARFAGDTLGGVFDFAGNVVNESLRSQTQLTDQNLAAVSSLAAQVSQSAQQSTNDSVQKIVTTIAIAGAAVLIFRSGK